MLCLMKTIKISAIIPTCDRPQYLPEAIASIRAQSLQPIEIIVANNGKVLIPEESLGADVQVLNLAPYVGVSAARNAGAKASSGDYLAFLDDDDKWDKDFLKHLAAKAIESNADYIVADLYRFFEDEMPELICSHSWFSRGWKESFYGRNPGFGGGNFLVTKSAFAVVGGFDEDITMSEDQVLPCELAIRDYKISSEPKAKYLVRHHSDARLSHSYTKYYFQFYHKCKKHMTFEQKVKYISRIWKIRLKQSLKKIKNNIGRTPVQ